MFCTNCGKELKEDEIFCPNCGTRNVVENAEESGDNFAGGNAEPVMQDEARFSPAPVQSVSKKSRRALVFVGIAAALVLCVGIVLGLRAIWGNIGGTPNQAMYIKDQEIFVKDLSKEEPQQISTRFQDATQDGILDLSEVSSDLHSMCTISADGSVVFFADKSVHLSPLSADSYSLYYKKLKNPKDEPVKIDSNVYSHQVNLSATLVTYRKGEETALYQYDIKTGEKEKIGNDVTQFSVSDDGEKIVYRDSEDRLYLKIRGKEKEKIDNNVAYFPGFRVSYELNYICYGKDGVLYKKPLDVGGKAELASYENMTFFSFYEDTGEAYYLNDNKLYYYDGTTATWISEGEYVDSIGYNAVADKTPVIVFKTQSIDQNAWHIAVKGDVYDFPDPGEYPHYLSVDPNGSCVYYVDNVTEGISPVADLYKVEIVEGIPQEPVLFDEGMSAHDSTLLGFVAPGKFAYYRDVTNGYGDLYINGELIDYGVRGSFFDWRSAPGYYAGSQRAIYYTDWDEERLCGTLRMCKDGEEPITVAEDVHDFTMLPSGDILYLYDFSSNSSRRGDLGVYRNGETETVDVDVSGIVPLVVNENYWSDQYYSEWSY